MSASRLRAYTCWQLAFLVCVNFVWAQQTGTIIGKVLQDNGSALSGATISAQAQRTTASTSPFRADAVTGKDGSFSLTVPAGTYRVCVQPKQDPLLNTCDWNLSPTSITVKAGATATVPSIQLQKGVPIQVQINDAQKFLPAAEGKQAGAGILVGLWLPSGLFVPMQLQSKGAATRTYSAPVPAGVKVNVSVHSSTFQINDGNGNPIDPKKGASVATEGNSGGPGQSFTFTVTGKQPVATQNQ